MLETAEVVQTIDRLDAELTDLAIRGLRAVGPQHLTTLGAFQEELERIGAGHLAGRIGAVITAIQNDDRSGAAALLKAQASLRVFERVLTLETIGPILDRVRTEPIEPATEEDE